MQGPTFSVTIPNLPKLQAAMANYPAIATPIVQRAIVACQAELLKVTNRGTVPIGKTGFLSQNWDWAAGNLQGTFRPRMFYAPYVELGTGIYGPKGAPFYINNFFGHPGRRVQMKGQRPNPFMERIVAASQPAIEALFEHAMDNITQAIASAAA